MDRWCNDSEVMDLTVAATRKAEKKQTTAEYVWEFNQKVQLHGSGGGEFGYPSP